MYYFTINYTRGDLTHIAINVNNLQYFKEKQDTFNENKFALKTNNPYILEGDHYVNKDAKKIIQKNSSSNEQLSLSSNEILLENDNYLYRVDFTNGIVYGKQDRSLYYWMHNDSGFEIGDANNQLTIAPTLLFYKNLKTENGTTLEFDETLICFKYFLNNNEVQINVPNEINGTLGLAMYRHQVLLGIGDEKFLYVFYSTRTTECNTVADVISAIKPDENFNEYIFSLNEKLLGLLHFNKTTEKLIITINKTDVEVVSVEGICKKI